jgi:SecD/SecF fusion protein
MFKRILIFAVMLAVIAALTAVAFTGIDLVIFEIPSVQDGIILGLDLQGGSIITYEAEPSQINDATLSDDMAAAQEMLRQRLDALGYTEAQLYPASATRIRVEIPDLENPEEAVRMIGSTAQLEFRTSDGTIWLSGDAVESANPAYGDATGSGVNEHFVELAFKEEFRATWAEATKFAASQTSPDNYVALYMDGEPVKDDLGNDIKPTVSSEFAETGIEGDSCVVTFGATAGASEEVRNFANLVNIGKLPFQLNQVQLSSVGPTLGADSLNTSLIAGAIGLGLVILFMLAYYRLPGLMAAISLIFYTALVAIVLSVMRVNLSLPGIAGIILSIGMAVDANVVIFERIKEELRSGKTVKGSVDSGFKRALTAIIDSNITTIIAGAVLLAFGTGAIKGFAITLLVGVILSMITVLIVSRLLLNQMVSLGVTALPFYGVKTDRSEPRFQRLEISFTKKFKWFGLPSLIICLFAAVCLVLLPFGATLFNFDIDFIGGTSFHLETGKNLTSDDLNNIAEAVREVTGQAPSAPQKVGETQVLIKTSDIDSETRQNVIDRIKQDFAGLETLETANVGSSVGSDLRRSAILSVIVAAALILLYITIRFQFSSGLAAVVALIHDLLIILAAYVLFQIPINMNFIAVMLTILGYSINSTIVVFDRVRENKRLMQKTTFADIVDRSIKQTMGRNINTTLTTLLPVVCIIILGVPSVRNFAVPLLVGLLAGMYSSICLSGSIWHRISNADKKAEIKLKKKA